MTLHIALIEPRIPPNTGNIARLCAATDTPLHLIEPLGFSLDDKHVKRAGLDYWDRVDLWIHPNWFRFRDAISRDRCLYFSAHADRDYRDAPFASNSVLIFGSETDGLPQKILDKHPERCYRIPMPGEVRSLNLANAVSVVLYEGLRQLGVTDVPQLEQDEEPPDGQTVMIPSGEAVARGPARPRSRGRSRGRR